MAKSLAVKYRPKSIDDVIGQTNAKATISNFLKKKKAPAAVLLTGATGCGKTTLARIIARTLNCNDGTGCGKCDSCVTFDTNVEMHRDYKEVNAANERGIDDIRGLITLSRYSPQYNTRVIVLDEAHQLTSQSANALLKDLEEPSQDTMWVLATTNPEKLLKPLVNRCLSLHLSPVPTKELAQRLYTIAKKEKHDLDKQTVIKIAEYSGGMVRDSIAALEKLINIIESNPEADKNAAIDETFLKAEDMELTIAASGILIGIYEGSATTTLKCIAQVKDFPSLVSKLSFMNGFVIYSIMKMADSKVVNPYYATFDNRQIFDAIKPDIANDKDKRRDYLKRAIKATSRIKTFRETLFGSSSSDNVSMAIACLLND